MGLLLDKLGVAYYINLVLKFSGARAKSSRPMIKGNLLFSINRLIQDAQIYVCFIGFRPTMQLPWRTGLVSCAVDQQLTRHLITRSFCGQ